MKKLILTLIVLLAVGVGTGAYYVGRSTKAPDIRTALVTRGDIVDAVAATGTLESVTTVEVGTQIGGVIQELYADFNSIVKKGQVIARLDPTLLQTSIVQQRANVVRAEADLDRLKVQLADSTQKLDRAKTLFAKNLLPQTDLDAANVEVRSADAEIKSSEAALTQARSMLSAAEVNLTHTVITAPIDGIVISREVEPGQTVNAGMSAPTLFVLAADMTKMQVDANIDESDVGRMRPGQNVTFRVDAFPSETFTGRVSQVRLNPTTVSNVVTYQTVIDAPNPELKLKPGMTANVNIEVSRQNNVLQVPSAATRFRPTAEMFAALRQTMPTNAQRADNQPAGGRQAVAVAPVAANAPRPTGTGGQRGRVASTPSIATSASSVDELFAPPTPAESRGTVWVMVDKQLKPVRLRLGATDGTNSEVLDGSDLPAGAEVVTNVILPTTRTAGAAGGPQNPLMGPQRGRPGGPGPGGPGGGRGF